MNHLHTLNVLAATLVSGSLASSAMAHGDLGGLMPYVDNGMIVTGHYDMHDGTGLVTDTGPTYVYVTELQANWEGGGTPGTNHPGIVTDGSSPNDPDGQNYIFPANTALTATANLLPALGANAAFWDGSGAVSFGTSPHAIVIEDAFNSITLDGNGTAPVGTITPWISDINGEGHNHIEFLIDEADATASSGVYLLSLTFDANGVLPSEPVYFVLGYGLAEPEIDVAIEAAGGWVQQNLVPEPGALTFVVLGVSAVVARRRRD